MLKNLQTEAHKLQLTPREKAAMRARIFGMQKSPYHFLSLRFAVPSLLVVVVLVSGGTVSAAQQALPGDLLYPIKIAINERVEAAAAPTTEAKAEVFARQAERRVEEAQALAVAGRLDAETSAVLGASFEAQAAAAEALAQTAEAEEEGKGAGVRVRLAAALQVQGQILETLGKAKDHNTKTESGALAARIIARATARAPAAQIRAFAAAAPAAKNAAPAPAQETTEPDAAISLMVAGDEPVAPAAAPITDEKAKKFAERLHKKATQVLADVQKRFDDARGLDATTTARITQVMADAEETMSDGRALLEAASYEAASGKFQDVLVSMTRLDALLQAEKKFDHDLIRALLERQ